MGQTFQLKKQHRRVDREDPWEGGVTSADRGGQRKAGGNLAKAGALPTHPQHLNVMFALLQQS